MLPPLPADALAVPHESPAAAAARGRCYPPVPACGRQLAAAARWRLARSALVRGAAQLKAGAATDARATWAAGLALAGSALALHEACPDAHKYAGILAAKAAADTRARIAAGHAIRDHTARALALRPADPVLAHVMGVWCYEVANLGWVQRQVAAALFGAPPVSSFADALRWLRRSEDLASQPGGSGPMLCTRLKLAQAHFASGDVTQARDWITRSLQLQPGVADDAEDVAAQRALAAKLGVPRKVD